MKPNNKSPGISQRGYVSSNESGSSSNDIQPKQLANNSRIKQHSRGLSQGSYTFTTQSSAHNNEFSAAKTIVGHTSNSSTEDYLNDDSGKESSTTTTAHTTHLANNNNNGSSSGAEAGGPSNQSNLQQFSSTDELDSLIPHSSDATQRTRAVLEHFQSKIIRTKEAIKTEQNSRDENVNEYLKLAANADKNQLQRIKSVFEKKNQKSAQTIAHLQKKLDNYSKKIKETEKFGYHHKQTREIIRDFGQGLKDVGVNIREGVTGVSGSVIGGIKSSIHSAGETVMTKPKEFFKNRFTSSENVNSSEINDETSGTSTVDNECGDNIHKVIVVKNGMGGAQPTASAAAQHHLAHSHSQSHSHSTKYTTDDDDSSSITSGSGRVGQQIIAAAAASLDSSSSPLRKNTVLHSTGAHQSSHIPVVTASSERTAVTPTSMADFEQIVIELKERREQCRCLAEEVESMKSQLQNECSAFHQSLQEERYRFERLEEQMNDLIELHQNEIENLKQNMVDMEEKVQYQSEERLRDVHEMLESCQTKISRMEHQQHQHLQQLVNLDSLENSNARALVLKLINVVLTILQVVLLLVATIANIISPFLQTRLRIVSSILLLIAIMLVYHNWPDFGLWTRQKISENWIYFSSST
ncbi:transmembrane and coiled-coil domains protein 2-like isoform X2 [Oppia nitens]|uniref:transmembrane and coiled-coil domains protein 2-like isoform X2 n=1 Tax=Oppia nitens TaxID=1686743 RepID=UPI0023DB9A32|nr:transmembrane and coiled-coil domains protein 2-like isoform X2 [Oppia nitens]